jgi:hypothetical protein
LPSSTIVIWRAHHAREATSRRGTARTNEAKKLSADAEAYFNKTVAASITPAYVEYKALEKWNGELPQMMGGGSSVPFVTLNSPKPGK